MKAFIREIKSWIYSKIEEELGNWISRNVSIDNQRYVFPLFKLLFPNDKKFVRNFKNPSGEIGIILEKVKRELFEEIGFTPELFEEVNTYKPKKKERGTKVITTRTRYLFTEDSPYSFFDWKEGKKIGTKDEEKVKKTEVGLGPPPTHIKIIRAEKGNTFRNKIAWDEYWEKENGDYTKLTPWIGSLRLLQKISEELRFEGKNVLEVGCGANPALLKALSESETSANILGTDFSRLACSRAKKLYPEAEFLKCFHPYSRTPWKRGAFDYIFCTLTLHNFHRQAKGATLLTLDHGLKRGGKLIIVEPSSKREDIYEIRQLLESMGYVIKVSRIGIKLYGKIKGEEIEAEREVPRKVRFYVVIAEKTEDKEYPVERWIAKSYLKDRKIKEAIQIAEKNKLNLKNLFEEIKREDEIDVINPPPHPYKQPKKPRMPPPYETILEEVRKEVLEEIPLEGKNFILELESKLKEKVPKELVFPLVTALLKGMEKGYLSEDEVLSFSGFERDEILKYGPFVSWRSSEGLIGYLFEPVYWEKLGIELGELMKLSSRELKRLRVYKFYRDYFYHELLISNKAILLEHTQRKENYPLEIYFFDPKEAKQEFEGSLESLRRFCIPELGKYEKFCEIRDLARKKYEEEMAKYERKLTKYRRELSEFRRKVREWEERHRLKI